MIVAIEETMASNLLGGAGEISVPPLPHRNPAYKRGLLSHCPTFCLLATLVKTHEFTMPHKAQLCRKKL